MRDMAKQRRHMVRTQLAARGIGHDPVLEAMEEVPRESFVAPEMVEFAYHDSALPIDEKQTISQPYIVALMAEALELAPEDRVLDVGTGSGYAAAVLSRMVEQVFTIERHRSLAQSARRRFEALGYDNIHVRVGDGSLGWPEEGPFDAIQVAAGGPRVPQALVDQLAPGGRMVIPVGEDPRLQKLLRIRRTPQGLRKEDLGDVRFVPLLGVQGWTPSGEPASSNGHAGRPGPDEQRGSHASAGSTRNEPPVISRRDRLRRAAEPFDGISEVDLEPLLERIGDARVVLLGEATHGTSEFYRMRTRITRELVEKRGFRIVAVEADWPDATRVDSHVRDRPMVPPTRTPFTRFPTWMWANEEVGELVEVLADFNQGRAEDDRAGFFGLDLYSLHASLAVVLEYLDEVDPEAAAVARQRYGCLTPWESDPSSYGHAVLTGGYRSCEDEVVRTLKDLLQKRLDYEERSGADRFFDASLNARLVADAELYYRIMYFGGRASWNLRDQHMFDTLEALLDHHGPDSRAVVWEHNSHIGDARATEMSARGEHNVGQLCRQRFGSAAYAVGFGTHTGTVAAAHDWGDPVEIMSVRPSHAHSYERLCHDAELDRFLLPLRGSDQEGVRRDLLPERLERAIGVIYRPHTELQSHYFHASLPRQFDEYVWFDQTRAVTPLDVRTREERTPETYPFGV